MADLTPEEINKQFERLRSLATTLGKDLSKLNLRPIKEDAALVGELIEKWNDQLDESLSSVENIASGFQDVVQQFSSGNIALASTKKEFNALTGLAQKMQYYQAGINDLTKKELLDIQKKAAQSKENLKTSITGLEQRKSALIDENRSDAISLEQKKKNRAEIQKINSALIDANSIVKEQDQHYQDLLISVRHALHEQEEVNKALGVGGHLIHGMQHSLEHLGLGKLAETLGLEEAVHHMHELAEEAVKAGKATDTFAFKLEVLKSGISTIGKTFVQNLTDPAVVITATIGGLIHAFQHVDKEISQVAKDLGIGRDEAQSMVLEMEHMANHSNNVFINTEKLVKANTELNKLFGTAVVMNEEMLTSYTELTTQAGYSVEEASKLAQISVANGDSIKENTSAILGQVAALNAENGLAINTKDIMADISRISSATTLTLGNQPEKLAAAAFKAKQFGMELNKLEDISQGLLNFEESISAELEAELLTGKDLNLEKARQAALNGDLATVAEEIAKQTGTAAEFAKMNVIQQEALAKSVGMTRDDLAKSVMEREALAKLSGEEGKTAQEKFNNLVKEVGLEEAKKRLGNEQLANQLASVSSQEKLAAAATKLQEIFASLVTPLMPVLDIFGSIFEVVGPIVGAVGTLVGYLSSALKYLIPIYGVYKGIQASQTASLVISRSASIIEAGKLTLLQRQLATEGELSLLDKITLGLAQAKLFVFNQQYRTKVLEATQEKLIQGLNKVSLAIQEAYQAVKLRGLATTASDIAMQTALKAKQLGGFLVDVGKFAIKSAISVASIPIIGPVLAIGAIAAAVAGGMSLYNKFKGDDVISGGYGKRTLMAPEGAIALNDKDTVIAGTDLGGKNKSKNTTSESPSQTNTTPSIDITPLVDRMAAVEGLLSQILQKETNIYMDSTKVGTGFAMSTSKIQ